MLPEGIIRMSELIFLKLLICFQFAVYFQFQGTCGTIHLSLPVEHGVLQYVQYGQHGQRVCQAAPDNPQGIVWKVPSYIFVQMIKEEDEEETANL